MNDGEEEEQEDAEAMVAVGEENLALFSRPWHAHVWSQPSLRS